MHIGAAMLLAALSVASVLRSSVCSAMAAEVDRFERQAPRPHPHGPHVHSSSPPGQTIGFLQQFCPRYGEWDTHKCWWPDTPYEQLPASCRQPVFDNTDLPKWFLQTMGVKQREVYDRLAVEHKSRGAPKRCGHCSKSLRCRTRLAVDALPWCTRDQQLELVPEHSEQSDACGDSAPCELTAVEGACPAPLFFEGVDYLNDRMASFFINADGNPPPPGPIFTAHPESDRDHEFPLKSDNSDVEEEIRSSVQSDGRTRVQWPVAGDGAHGRQRRQAGPQPHAANMLLAQIALSRQRRAMLASISDMLTGTTCVRKPSSDTCLCCCGPYVPSVVDNKCVDGRDFLPSLGQIEAHLNTPRAAPGGPDEFVQQQFLSSQVLPELQALFQKHVATQ